MKVLFINPPNKPFSSNDILIEPIDLLTLATFVEKQGHEVKIIDMDAGNLMPEKIEDQLVRFCPQFIVFAFDYHIPLHTSDSIEYIMEIAKIAMKYQAKIIVGGKTATYFPQKFLFIDSPIDFVIRNEMELTLKELLDTAEFDKDKIKNINGLAYLSLNKIIKTGTQQNTDPEHLPIPNRDLIEINKYIDVRTILSSRGCIMNCTFCPSTIYWRGWRSRSPENVVDEIYYLVKRYKAKKILFLDDNATIDNERMIKISSLILKKKINVKLGCLGSLSLYNDTTMKLMHRAGFRWIHYGIESGNNDLLKKINKNLNRIQIEEVIKKTKKIGFRIRTSWILDLPNTDEKALDDTIELILKTQTEEIRLHYLSLRLGSRLFSDFSKNNFHPQYIHSNNSNINLTYISKLKLNKKVNYLIKELSANGYLVIKKTGDLHYNNKSPQKFRKLVSLCPLRYGINW